MIKKYVFIAIALVLNISCEDVIEVEVPSEKSRLVIDALIRIDSSLDMIDVAIKASESASFFDSIQPANLTEISLRNIDTAPGSPFILSPSATEAGTYEASIPRTFFIEGGWY